MYTCPCCFAMSEGGPPHGECLPCPTAMLLHEAEISERKTHGELLAAQRDATKATTAR